MGKREKKPRALLKKSVKKTHQQTELFNVT